MAAQLRNREATILHDALPHQLNTIIIDEGRSPSVLFIMDTLTTFGKLPTPVTHHLLTHDVRPIDLTELPMNFNWRNALCIKELYHRPNLAGGGRRNKSFHFGPLAATLLAPVTDPVYLDVLKQFVYSQVVALQPNIFQQDGAPPHWSMNFRRSFNATFPNRWIGRDEPIWWPQRSPDLTPLDFFLWGYVKDRVFATPLNDIVELRTRIRDVIAIVTEQLFAKSVLSAALKRQVEEEKYRRSPVESFIRNFRFLRGSSHSDEQHWCLGMEYK
ncbi:hypothetical protein ANN_03475 [Periplaneta americana]|uniref:Uncharacterized protein n=1 Tax=Periplaneta americana TaxID=6978 RepID=A0ABQ8TZ23_PERAM|nr:hypothetical protein ANN_03475 [Periplaneta americana]